MASFPCRRYKQISTLVLRVLIFTLYTYKYHKIYIVYSYTIINDRKKRRHNDCGTTNLYVGLPVFVRKNFFGK